MRVERASDFWQARAHARPHVHRSRSTSCFCPARASPQPPQPSTPGSSPPAWRHRLRAACDGASDPRPALRGAGCSWPSRARLCAADLSRRAVALGLEATGLGAAAFAGGEAVGIRLRPGRIWWRCTGRSARWPLPSPCRALRRASCAPPAPRKSTRYRGLCGRISRPPPGQPGRRMSPWVWPPRQRPGRCWRAPSRSSGTGRRPRALQLGDFGTAAAPLDPLA